MIKKILTSDSYELKSFNWECFSFDTETTSLRYDELAITGISLCDGTHNYYIPIKDDNREATMKVIKNYFSKAKKVVAQNWVFDAKVMSKYGISFEKQKFFDTRIASHLINENTPNGLKYMTRSILGREVADFDINLSHYCQEFYDYALDDSLNTWLLYKHFLPKILEDKKLCWLFFKVEMPFQRVLLEMELEGVMINQPLLKSQQQLLINETQKLQSNMLDILGVKYELQLNFLGDLKLISPINFNSSQQLTKIFNDLKLVISEKTPGGNPSVGKLTLEKHKKHSFVDLLIKFKIASKLMSGFVEPLPEFIQSDGKVRPSFNDTGTKTGRLSCSRPNLQQLPKVGSYAPAKIRELFIAPKGYKMFSVDYSGQEIAVMAQQSKDPTLVKSLNKGYDMHLAIANKFYHLGIPEEALSKQHADYEGYKATHDKARGRAKRITFGLAYGKGAYGFAKDFGISEDAAQKIVDDYFKGIPLLGKAIQQAHAELERSGVVTTLAGRKRHFVIEEGNQWQLERAKRQAFNFLIQGFSADMIRAASINVHKRKQPFDWGLTAIMTVHDEVVYIVKEDHVVEATQMVKQAFEDVCKNFVVPVNADIEVGTNYGNSK